VAIRATFARRETPLPVTQPFALSEGFAQDAQKQTQWKAFLRKCALAVASLGEVVADLQAFLLPMLDAAQSMDGEFAQTWTPGRGWTFWREGE